ncbi:MAG: UbiD family decarboxylase [Chloroflexi bacterium]|nr:UbiD family decarboxylase [Chloroflexota bacterium]
MAYRDLREWLSEVEGFGELKRIEGADWNLELSGITELTYREARRRPALLFDNIKDYPAGYRVLFGSVGSARRAALTLGVRLPQEPANEEPAIIDLVRAVRDRLSAFQRVVPTYVGEGPVTENVATGDEIDLYRFPIPFYHELDGGRYVGTGHAVITRDPDDGWVNLGTYRVMIVNKNTLALHINPGRHGALHRQKYFEKGQPCPVAISVGHDPLLFLTSIMPIPHGVSEYEYAGGFKGEPIEVMKGPVTGLPIPARAEIVIEGEYVPEMVPEGPFGEWCGYYANNSLNPVPEPIVRVKSVMYRTNPILHCAMPGLGCDYLDGSSSVKAALIWDQLERAGISDVKGVWCHESGGGNFLKIVSIKQRFPGHAKQAALVASQSRVGAYLNRYVVVVDEDIDPTNTKDVLWAMCTRSDPEKDIDILRRCWGSTADPLLPPGENVRTYNSVAVIDACRPFEWMKDFPPVAGYSPQLRETLMKKWGSVVLER